MEKAEVITQISNITKIGTQSLHSKDLILSNSPVSTWKEQIRSMNLPFSNKLVKILSCYTDLEILGKFDFSFGTYLQGLKEEIKKILEIPAL